MSGFAHHPFTDVNLTSPHQDTNPKERTYCGDVPAVPTLAVNTLHYGDNLEVLRAHIAEESIDLIYLDPPFSSNRNYFVLFKDRTGKASAAQEEAFTDTWTWTEDTERWYREIMLTARNRDLATLLEALRTVYRETPLMAYLVAMSIRFVELHRVLKTTGSFYLHCDPTASHYLKLVLDAVFEPRNFRNEILWKRTSAHANVGKRYGVINDSIFFYTKSSRYTWNPQYAAYSSDHEKNSYRFVEEETGRRYASRDLTASMQRASSGQLYEWKGIRPPASRCWACSEAQMRKYDADGRILYSRSGYPRLKVFLEDMPGVPLQTMWLDVPVIAAQSAERLGYPTQKPLALLERIITASSNAGDIVLDPFCGCGTTVTAAHKLGRKWVGIDLTAVAIGIMKSRLEHTFEDLKGKVAIEGMPRDYEGAQTLFETDPHRFQAWACTLINAYPLTKKGADAGIDGWLPFLDLDDKPHKAVVQVKGGKNATLSQVRDFCHVVTREKAALGFFLCLGDITPAMHKEAVKEGFWRSVGGVEYPKVQLLSVGDLLTRQALPRYPAQDKASLLGYKATPQARPGEQKNLFGQD